MFWRKMLFFFFFKGLPWWLRWQMVKNLPGDPSLIPGSRRSPGERNSYIFQCSCLEKSMARGAWWATVHWLQRVRQEWATNTFSSLSLFESLYWIFYTLLLFYILGFWPRGMWDLSSLTKDRTSTPCIESQVSIAASPAKSWKTPFFRVHPLCWAPLSSPWGALIWHFPTLP